MFPWESALLAASEGGRWHPGIGDPTALGWVTVAAYLVAAIACALASRREPMTDGTRRPAGRPSRFWLLLAALMLALGINKQLDLQSLVTQTGRDVVRALNLYSGRREIQMGFIAVVILICLATVTGLLWVSRRTLRRRGTAIAGMMFILGFVMIRASSFHHVDAFLGAQLVGLRWNWILELGGISVVAAAALRILLDPPGRPPRPDGASTYSYRVNSG